jgi:uncharacterized protein (DUF305 family)
MLALAACQPAAESEVDANANAPAIETATTEPTADPHAGHDMSAMASGDNEVEQAYMVGMTKMHDDMMAGMQANDADVAFAKGMLPHHEGAVDMAKVQLKYGKDDAMRQLATEIIAAQEAEIAQMQQWLTEHPDTEKQDNTAEMHQAYEQSMQAMHDDMMAGIKASDPDMAFAKGMLPHHQGAIAMAEVQLKYGKDEAMRKLAEDIIAAQKVEIATMESWIANHS